MSFKALFSDIKGGGLSEGNLVVSGKKTRAIPKQYGQISKFKNVEIFIWNGVPNDEIEFKDTRQSLWKAFRKVEFKRTSERSN